jgi:hypothetical protein
MYLFGIFIKKESQKIAYFLNEMRDKKTGLSQSFFSRVHTFLISEKMFLSQ